MLKVLLVVVLVLFIAGYIAYKKITSIPDEYTPAVYTGANVVQKKLFAQDARIDIVTDMKFGQLDPNDGFEYCIAGNQGAIFLDENGKQLKFIKLKDEKYPIYIYEIVTDNQGTCSFKTDGFPPKKHPRSRLIPKHIADKYPLAEIDIVPFPTEKDDPHFLLFDQDRFILLDKTGAQKAHFAVPYLCNPKGMPIRFRTGEPPCFVILGKLCFQGTLAGFRAVHPELFIFDPKQELVYHEVLEDDVTVSGTAILSAPSGCLDEQVLLVGGTGRIWQYSLKK